MLLCSAWPGPVTNTHICVSFHVFRKNPCTSLFICLLTYLSLICLASSCKCLHNMLFFLVSSHACAKVAGDAQHRAPGIHVLEQALRSTQAVLDRQDHLY